MRVMVEGGADEIEGEVPHDADFDGVFVVTTDDGTRFKVHGWSCITIVMD